MDYLYYKAHKEIFSPSCCLLGLWKINADNLFFRNQKANENLYFNHLFSINKSDYNYILVALRTLEGEGTLTLDNITYNLKKDSLIFFKLCQSRKYRSISANWSFIWCEFLINFNPFDLNSIYHVNSFEEETQFFDMALKNKNNEHNIYISSLFATQIILWEKYATREKILDLTNEERINGILSFISVNYSNSYLSITHLAEMINLSDRRFRTLFKEIVGVSPKTYITGYRMKIACGLLANTDLPISQIAAKVGYENQSYFCNAFNHNFNMSPTEYIEKNRK